MCSEIKAGAFLEGIVEVDIQFACIQVVNCCQFLCRLQRTCAVARSPGAQGQRIPGYASDVQESILVALNTEPHSVIIIPCDVSLLPP